MLRAFLWAVRLFRTAPHPAEQPPQPREIETTPDRPGSLRCHHTRNGATWADTFPQVPRRPQLSKEEVTAEYEAAYFAFLCNAFPLAWTVAVRDQDWERMLTLLQGAEVRVRWLANANAPHARKGA